VIAMSEEHILPGEFEGVNNPAPIIMIDQKISPLDYVQARENDMPLFVIFTSNTCLKPEHYHQMLMTLPPLDNIVPYYCQNPDFLPLLVEQIKRKVIQIQENIRKDDLERKEVFLGKKPINPFEALFGSIPLL